VPFVIPNDEPIFDNPTLPSFEELSLTGPLSKSGRTENTRPIGQRWSSKHLETIPISRKLQAIKLNSTLSGSENIPQPHFDDEDLKYFAELTMNRILMAATTNSV